MQSRNFSTVKEIFHNQGNFPQSRKFSTIDEIFHSCKNFPQTKNFTQSKKFSANKDHKGSLKAKILNTLNMKSYAKNIFGPLMLVSNKKSYVLTQAISFLSTYEH